MQTFSKTISIRWSDLDPNFHLRHSAYYDFAAQQRIEALNELGLTIQAMQQQHVGPILFREECIFKREIRLADQVTLTCRMARLSADASRWTIQHQFLSPDNKVLAILTVDGAWMDTTKRKLASPTPQGVVDALSAFPKTDDFGNPS